MSEYFSHLAMEQLDVGESVFEERAVYYEQGYDVFKPRIIIREFLGFWRVKGRQLCKRMFGVKNNCPIQCHQS